MRAIINSILDFILPRSQEEKILDSIDAETFSIKARSCRSYEPDIFALFDYKDPLVKNLVWQLKFKGNKKRATLIAEIMHDHIIDLIAEKNLFDNFVKPVIIPVPLSIKREKQRGFNQCRIVSGILASLDKNSNFEVNTDAVIKIKDTVNQTNLETKSLREKNLSGCFTVQNPSSMKNRNVIIIDDVYTTGTTIRELKKGLLVAGANKVIGLAFAH